jgi:hypothetical protein
MLAMSNHAVRGLYKTAPTNGSQGGSRPPGETYIPIAWYPEST